MIVELSAGWLVAVDALAWLAVHLGVAYGFTQLPDGWFRPEHPLCRERGWEAGGRFYERWLGVRAWKDMLPDGASWFRGGFAKRSLRGSDPGHLGRFVRETCRGEVVHWVVMGFAPLFLLWNPWEAGAAMFAYAAAANLPCIVAQRYNRIRLRRVMARK